jgi:hypothetical protein
MTPAGDDLRSLIAEVVREAMQELVSSSVREAAADGRPSNGKGIHGAQPADGATPFVSQPDSGGGRVQIETVRISGDADLNAFALRLLHLFENPKSRQDLRAGRISFRCAQIPGRADASVPVRRIERGAVTEREIKAAAEAGERIVLGRGAVLTPLAREKARSLGLSIGKERLWYEP